MLLCAWQLVKSVSICMLRLERQGWGRFVVKLFRVSCRTFGLGTVAASRVEIPVDNTGSLYQSSTAFIPGLFHYFFGLFESVKRMVLQAIHTTYNNKRQDLFNLVTNS
jgi:hypothetical protein